MFLKRARGEMADTLALGASAVRRRGSNPLGRINKIIALMIAWQGTTPIVIYAH